MKTVEKQEYSFETSTDAYDKDMFPLVFQHSTDMTTIEITTFDQLLEFLETCD